MDRDIDDPAATPAELSLDVDPVAVAEAVVGRVVRLTLAEQQAASAQLTARGASAEQVAQVIGRSARTVVRHRARSIEGAA